MGALALALALARGRELARELELELARELVLARELELARAECFRMSRNRSNDECLADGWARSTSSFVLGI
jgi:hypothetical protein